MAAPTITFNPQLQGQGSYNPAPTTGALAASVNLGTNFTINTPGLTYATPPVGSAYANGVLTVADWYQARLTIANGTTTSINFNTGAFNNPFGTPLAWTVLKIVIISVVAPDGVIFVKVGPNAVSNAAQLWFGAVSANVYESVYFTAVHYAPAAGWTITASTACLLPINNPGGSSIQVDVFAAGSTS